MMNPSESYRGEIEKPQYTEQFRKLIELGFEQIGVSNLFQQGEFVISLDQNGSPHLFVNYDRMDTEGDVLGVRKGDSFNGFSLQFLKSSDRGVVALERTINGSGGGIWNESKKPKGEDFQGKTIEQQLLEAGFTKDDSSRVDVDSQSDKKQVFRINVEEHGETYEIIATVVNGKLEKLLKPIDNRVSEHITPGTKILEYSTKPKEFGGGESSLVKLSNGQMEFVASSQYGGDIVQDSQKVLRELNVDELGLRPIEIIEEESGFKIGGINDSELIRKLKKINGQTIEELEQRMRPNNDSMAGFLGADERLVDVLVADNDFVLSQGLTHQDLAEPLKFAQNFAYKGFGSTFQYRGGNYQIDLVSYRGIQFSPFEDRTGTNSDATITNLDNGEQVSLSLLIPDMAERYGFYEGKGTSYRVEPSQIIKVFSHLAEQGRQALITRNVKNDISSTLKQEKE